MNRTFNLEGKTAVVTGAAQGIGWACAEVLAGAGADVVIADINEEKGQDAVKKIEDIGVKSIFVKVDVRDSASVDAMKDRILEQFGKIDILVNNAGIGKNTPAEEVSDDEWLNIINVNLNGVFFCCRSVGKHMLERGRGVIINIASMSGMIVNKPQPQAAYNASKAGAILLTKSLAAEWAKRGVRVNSVSPGYIATELTKLGMTTDEWREAWFEMTPMNRVGEPEDVAYAVLFLASDEANYATGTNLVIDGGYTVW